jgi:hypothetical protein
MGQRWRSRRGCPADDVSKEGDAQLLNIRTFPIPSKELLSLGAMHQNSHLQIVVT